MIFSKIKNYMIRNRFPYESCDCDPGECDCGHTDNNYQPPKFDLKREPQSKEVKPIKISTSVINILHKTQVEMVKRYGYITDNSSEGQVEPVTFLLGQKGNVINKAVLLPSKDGCGNMPYIFEIDFNKTSYELIKAGYVVVGLARVGFFERGIGEYSDFGSALSELGTLIRTRSFAFVSLGAEDFTCHFVLKSDDGWIETGYQILSNSRPRKTKSKKEKPSWQK